MRKLLPVAFIVVGVPIVVLLTNSRFPNTPLGDVSRVVVGLVVGLVLGLVGYLVARRFPEGPAPWRPARDLGRGPRR
jgi:NhaP-type Na+/H+ or K+/H+ antiporter